MLTPRFVAIEYGCIRGQEQRLQTHHMRRAVTTTIIYYSCRHVIFIKYQPTQQRHRGHSQSVRLQYLTVIRNVTGTRTGTKTPIHSASGFPCRPSVVMVIISRGTTLAEHGLIAMQVLILRELLSFLGLKIALLSMTIIGLYL